MQSTWMLDRRLLERLTARVRQRLEAGLTLARADRFLQELEPGSGDEPDVFKDLASAFSKWRRALREGDADGCLDAVELAGMRLEVCRRQVEQRDAAVEAFRVRWACENAALRHQTVDSLARFYRLLPFSTASQSKYEYFLTRRLAGPVTPDRRLPSTEELRDAVIALEESWGAAPFQVDDSEAATTGTAIKSFGQQADEHKDAAGFTASALLRRFGTFKASIGEKLFDARLSVAVVETNVKVLNVLNHLLAEAGGKPLRMAPGAEGAVRPVRARTVPSLPVAAAPETESQKTGGEGAEEPTPFIQVARPATATGAWRRPAPPKLRTADVDLSTLEIVRRHVPLSPGEAAPPETESPAEALPSPPAPTTSEPAAEREVSPARDEADLRTGEVDLSGLEYVRRGRGSEAEPGAGAEPGSDREAAPDGSQEAGEGAQEAPPPADGGRESGVEEVDPEEIEQLPSARAYELAELEENAEIIQRYLTRPRSPEVWRLNLDSFLPDPNGEAADSQNQPAARRRALELILAADDLICLRATQEGAPTPEHRTTVKELAQRMLRLQTSLRRAAAFARPGQGELEPLLYVSDHLLWERLRLNASLTRKPVSRNRVPLLAPTSRATEAARRHALMLRRHRRILLSVVAGALLVAAVFGMLGASAPRSPVDPGVQMLQVTDFPEPLVFDEARAFGNRLFMTADLSWTRLGRPERQAIVRSVADFALERGYDSVSIIGPEGEALATFANNEIVLAEDVEVSVDEP